MILQSSHVVVDCPICGRPLEMESQFISHEIACGHCRGEFTVYETDDGSLATENPRGTNLLKRVDQLLCTASDTQASHSKCRCRQRSPLVSVSNDRRCQDRCQEPLLEDTPLEDNPQPIALLVEHRDEVFARIATDMAEFGVRVVRAKSATEALKLCGTYEPVLVVANVDLPDQSGWLLAGKMRFVNQRIRVWLYQTHSSSYDLGLVNFLNIEALLDCQGDLLGLSETIVALMVNRREAPNVARDSRKKQKRATA